MAVRNLLIVALTLGAALASTATPSLARQIYISPMVGYTTPGSLELGETDLNNVTLSGGLTYGGQIGFSAKPGFTFEASYMQQDSKLQIEGVDVLDLKVGQLHGNFLFEKIGYGSTTHPYFLLGLGASFFQPGGDFDGATRFSFSLGLGVKIEASEKVGLKIQGKYNPTYLDEDWGSTWCDPFYGCYQTADPDYLDQGEFSAGLTYKLGSE
jgi:opacity protein-like surface antigen